MKAARISKSRAVPAGEFGEAASFFDESWAGRKNEMIRVCENGLAAEFAHLGVSDSFDGGASSSTNKGGSLDVAMWGMNNADAHEAGLFDDAEFQHMSIESP